MHTLIAELRKLEAQATKAIYIDENDCTAVRCDDGVLVADFEYLHGDKEACRANAALYIALRNNILSLLDELERRGKLLELVEDQTCVELAFENVDLGNRLRAIVDASRKCCCQFDGYDLKDEIHNLANKPTKR